MGMAFVPRAGIGPGLAEPPVSISNPPPPATHLSPLPDPGGKGKLVNKKE